MEPGISTDACTPNGPSPVGILVVDDDVGLAEMTAEILGTEGFSVSVATSLEAAKDRLKNGDIVCALVDFTMTDGDGLDLLKHVRTHHGDDVVVIAVTGHMGEEGRLDEFLQNADHSFRKPIDWEALFKVIAGLR